MRNVPLGTTTAPNLILGLMRIADKTDAEIRTLVETAIDSGITMFDHADIYGTDHACEQRFGEAVRFTSDERERVLIQSKAGIVPAASMYDFSYKHLVRSAEASLRALRTDYLDVFLLHRPDALVEPDEVARAFDHLEFTGKVRMFGVSNHTPRQIELLRASVGQPLVVNQLQYSLLHAPLVAQGIAANTRDEQAVVVDGGGILDYCRIEGITIQTWGPFQGPNGVFLGSPAHAELNATISRLATEYGVSESALVAAWTTRHPAGMQVVLGSTSPARIREAIPGSDLPLTRAHWYELFRAAGHRLP